MSIIVIGSNGALGQNLLKNLMKSKKKVLSIEKNAKKMSFTADRTIVIPEKRIDSYTGCFDDIGSFAEEGEIAAIVNCAGGWVGGNLGSKSLIQDFYGQAEQSIESSLFAAQLAERFMKEGMLVLPGSSAVFDAPGGMIAYGMAKDAVHYLVKCCSNEGSGLSNKVTTIGLCPTILDTEMNRISMPDADFSDWTPLDDVSNQLIEWIDFSDARPTNGSLIRVDTKEFQTTFQEL